MRTFKRLIIFLFLLAVFGLVCAHWLVRSSIGVSCVESRIKAATGLDAQVASVRLGFGMGLTISDLRLTLKDEADGEQTVLVAPVLEVSGLSNKSGIRMARPVFTVVQSSLGNWTPSQLKDFVDSSSFWSSLSKLAETLDRRVEITDAAMVLKDSTGKELATYSGLSWYHSPVQMKGHPRLFHDVVSLQCINGQQVELSGEWLSDGDGMYFIGPVPVEMITEDDGTTDIEAEAAETIEDVDGIVEVPKVVAPEVPKVIEPKVAVVPEEISEPAPGELVIPATGEADTKDLKGE